MEHDWKYFLDEPHPHFDPYRAGHQEQYVVRVDPRTNVVIGQCGGMPNCAVWSDWTGQTFPIVFEDDLYPLEGELERLFSRDDIQQALEELAELAESGEPTRWTTAAEYISREVLAADCQNIFVLGIDEFILDCSIDDRILTEDLTELAQEIESWIESWVGKARYSLDGDTADIVAALERRKESLL